MEKNKTKNERVKIIKIISVTIIISLLFKAYIFSRAHVSGPSMMPTLINNDSVIVEKISLLTHNFKRGQIIVFDSQDTNHDIYIKRIIGIEGDEIELNDGNVYLNGAKLKETYIKEKVATHGGTFLHENQKIIISKGFVFVLGDNRAVSEDSRYLGDINIESIKGHVILKMFPLNGIKIF
ncbi:signal peptidase I [Clostridium akagii]|uniref:signal peptidase I n=1 Tax=Clostridium akagii TaxID=91623 RepID=UPI00047A8E39|nr:signal peptidase I [Clostridium akagii]